LTDRLVVKGPGVNSSLSRAAGNEGGVITGGLSSQWKFVKSQTNRVNGLTVSDVANCSLLTKLVPGCKRWRKT
jgi:hypothetical protein